MVESKVITIHRSEAHKYRLTEYKGCTFRILGGVRMREEGEDYELRAIPYRTLNPSYQG